MQGADGLTFIDVTDRRAPRMLTRVSNRRRSGPEVTLTDAGAILATPSARLPAAMPVPATVTSLAGQADDDPLTGSPTALSPDGLLLAVGGSRDDVTVWDIADPRAPEPRASLAGESLGVTSLAFSPDGTTLAVGTGAGVVQLWDVRDPFRVVLGERLRARPTAIDQVAFAAHSTLLVAVGDDVSSEDASGLATRRLARVWTIQDGVRTVSTIRIPSGRTATPAWDPTGRLIVAGFPARLWDVSRGDPPVPRGLLPSFALAGGSAFAFAPDGREITSGMPAVSWDVRDPAQPTRLLTDEPIREPADLVVYSPDGERVVIGSQLQDAFELWETTSRPWRRLADLTGSASRPQGAVFGGDSAFLVTITDRGGAVVWNLRREPPEQLARVPGDVTALAMDPRSDVLVTGDAEGDLSLWDLSQLDAPELLRRRSAHIGGVSGVAVHPTAAMIASAGEDGIRLWSTGAGGRTTLMGTLRSSRRFDGPNLAFSPDGRMLASSSAGGTEIWNVDIDGLLAQLCRASSAITREQWAEHLPDLPYDPPCMTDIEEGR